MSKTRFLLSVAGLVGCLIGVPAAAYATQGGHIVPGAKCSTIGDEAVHKGQVYRCEQKPSDDCPRWHWVHNADVPKSGRTSWPTGPCPCGTPTPTAVPSPSTPTTSPTASPTSTATASNPSTSSPAPSASTTDVPTLPVTAPDSVSHGAAGVGILGLGWLLVRAGRRRNPRKA